MKEGTSVLLNTAHIVTFHIRIFKNGNEALVFNCSLWTCPNTVCGASSITRCLLHNTFCDNIQSISLFSLTLFKTSKFMQESAGLRTRRSPPQRRRASRTPAGVERARFLRLSIAFDGEVARSFNNLESVTCAVLNCASVC